MPSGVTLNELPVNILNIADLSECGESIPALLAGCQQYRVLSAPSLEEVSRALEADNIQTIIADVEFLKKEEGLAIDSLLREEGRLKATPLLLLTNDHALLEGYPQAYVDIVGKPLKKNILLSRLTFFYRCFYAEKNLSTIENRLEATVEELNEKRVYLNNILQSTKHVAIVGIDLDFKIRYCNQESEHLLGYSSEKYIGKDIFSVIEENDISESEFQNSLQALIREGLYRFLYSRKGEKQKKILDTRVSFIKDQDGNRVGYLLVGHDITELKEKEEELNQKAFKLAQSNKELEQLAYIVSHDLREPLRTVSGFARILEDSLKERIDDDLKKTLAYINGGITRMGDMLNALLSYSRVGNENVIFENVNCDQLLEKVLFTLTSIITEKKADIIVEGLPSVFGDEVSLHQLFQNLIENSIKFCNGLPPRVVVKAEKEDGMWLFSISDNGIGIDNLFLERIFKIFQRLHQRDEYTGSGIGLAICKKIVENHSGRIWAESRVSKGSVFYFLIPEDQQQVL